MKYLKYSFSVMLIAVSMAMFNVNAETFVYKIVDIKIPVFSKAWTSRGQYKETNSLQYIKKTKCTDDLSGDGRVILAAVKNTSTNTNSGVVEAKPNIKVAIPNSQNVRTNVLYLQSSKSLPTTATFSGEWTVDN